jgi:probable F420-dependent oxidoreductase
VQFLAGAIPIGAPKHLERWLEGHDPVEIAVLIEELGFDAIGCGDHPFPTEAFMADGGHHHLDPFVELAVYAQATTEVRLVTSVLVAGHRNPYMTAKSIASLDFLSRGRFVLGIGAGYNKEEIEILGGDFHQRGKLLDEALVAMDKALSGEPVHHDGPAFPANGHLMQPPPWRKPRPPFWIGGNSDAAMRRAARYEGWMPHPQGAQLAKYTGSSALDSFELLARRIATAQQMHADTGATSPLEIWCGRFKGEDGRRTDNSLERLAEDLPGYEDAGVTLLTVGTNARSFSAYRDYLLEAADVLGLPGGRPPASSRRATRDA